MLCKMVYTLLQKTVMTICSRLAEMTSTSVHRGGVGENLGTGAWRNNQMLGVIKMKVFGGTEYHPEEWIC